MAKRFTNTSYDLNGDAWVLDIYDSEYSGSVSDIEIVYNSLNLEYQPSDETRVAPILSSTCSFTIVVQSGTENTFISDLASATEDQFRCTLSFKGSLEWAGVILTDQIQHENRSYPFNLTVNAADGINRLKDVDYADDSAVNVVPYEGKQTFIEHIFNILDRVGTLDLLGTDVFVSGVNWYDTNHPSTSVDPLANTRFDHRAVLQFDSQTGNAKYKSVYYVLEMISRVLNARFFMAGGAFHMVQINEYEDSDMQLFYYGSGGTLNTSDSSVTMSVEPTSEILGSSTAFFPGLKFVRLEFLHRLSSNNLSGADLGVTTTVEDVDASEDNTSLYLTTIARSFYAPGTITTPLFIEYSFNISITDGTDTYYLKREAEVVDGRVEYGEISWTQTSADRVLVYSGGPIQPSANTSITYVNSTPVNIAIESLPVSGDLSIRGTFQKTVEPDGMDAGISPTSATVFVNPYLEIADLTDRSNSRLHYARNATDGYTAAIEYTSLIGDGVSGNAPGNIDIYTGSFWRLPNNWGVGSKSGNSSFPGLFCSEILSAQDTPVERLLGSYHEVISARFSVKSGSVYYAPTQLTINAHRAETSGDWSAVSTNASAVDTPDTEDYFFPKDPTAPIDITDDVTVTDPLTEDDRIRGRDGADVDRNIYLRIPPFTTSDEITPAGGAITSIPTTEATADDLFQAGDKINVIDRVTGRVETFTVTSDVTQGDTSISVQSKTPAITLSETSYVTLDSDSLHTKLSKRWYRQTFTNHSTATCTITENGGVLPDNEAAVHVYINGQRVFNYTINNSDIELGFTPPGMDVIVEFYL